MGIRRWRRGEEMYLGFQIYFIQCRATVSAYGFKLQASIALTPQLAVSPDDLDTFESTSVRSYRCN